MPCARCWSAGDPEADATGKKIPGVSLLTPGQTNPVMGKMTGQGPA